MIRKAEAGDLDDDGDDTPVHLETSGKGEFGVTSGSKALQKMRKLNQQKMTAELNADIDRAAATLEKKATTSKKKKVVKL